MNNIDVYLGHFSSIYVIVPFSFAIYTAWKKQFRLAVLNLAIILFIVGGISDALSYILFFKLNQSPVLVTNVYLIAQFVILSLIYTLILKEIRKLIITIVVAFLVCCILAGVFVDNKLAFENLILVPSSITLIVYSAFHLFYRKGVILAKTKTLQVEELYSAGIYFPAPFWFSAGVFYYFAFNLHFFIEKSYLFNHLSVEIARSNWIFHSINSIVKNTCYIVFIYQLSKYGMGEKKVKWDEKGNEKYFGDEEAV